MIRPGRLRRQIQIWRKVTAKDNYGQVVQEWSLYKTVKGDEIRLRGREMIESKEKFDSLKAEFVVRNQHGIREQDRIKYDGFLYKIDATIPDYDRRFLTIKCTRHNE